MGGGGEKGEIRLNKVLDLQEGKTIYKKVFRLRRKNGGCESLIIIKQQNIKVIVGAR